MKSVLIGLIALIGIVTVANCGEEENPQPRPQPRPTTEVRTRIYAPSPTPIGWVKPTPRPVPTLPKPSATARAVNPTPTLVPLYAPTDENCEAMQWTVSQMKESGMTQQEVAEWTLEAFPYDMVVACIEKGY